jgi:hypothetical protein
VLRFTSGIYRVSSCSFRTVPKAFQRNSEALNIESRSNRLSEMRRNYYLIWPAIIDRRMV